MKAEPQIGSRHFTDMAMSLQYKKTKISLKGYLEFKISKLSIRPRRDKVGHHDEIQLNCFWPIIHQVQQSLDVAHVDSCSSSPFLSRADHEFHKVI